MFIIAGLGNPTKTYEGTRHNIGFEVIDVLADRCRIDVSMKKNKSLCGMGYIEGQKVILAKPQTYMNLSGEAVRELAAYYKVEPEYIIVVYDDISPVSYTHLLENSFFYIDIYDYDGDLIGRLDLSDVTEFAKCAQYLCSTDKYIFIGEASTPLCRGVYVVEKQRVKDCFSQARQIY